MRTVLGVAVVVSLLFVAQASSAQPRTAMTAHAATSDRIVTYFQGEPFLDPRYVVVDGRAVDGGCAFVPPALELPAGDRGIAMRQLSMDYANCRTVIEIGKRLRAYQPPEGGLGSGAGGMRPNRVPAEKGTRTLQSRARATATRSGTYEIRWLDRIDLTLNRTQAKLTWSYNGSCVTSWSPGAYWWWQSETGWSKDEWNSGFWSDGGCNSYYSHATGVFWNDRFCSYVVGTKAGDVRFRGGYAGGYGGSVGELWVTDSCQPLHYDADLWAS